MLRVLPVALVLFCSTALASAASIRVAVVPARVVLDVRAQTGARAVYVPTAVFVGVVDRRSVAYRFTGWSGSSRPPIGYQFNFKPRGSQHLEVSFAVDVRPSREACAGRSSQQGAADRVFRMIGGRRIFWQNTHSWEMAWWCAIDRSGRTTVIRAFTVNVEPSLTVPPSRLAAFVASARLAP